MTEIGSIFDPHQAFIQSLEHDVIDFVFRLTGDRSRASLMGKEACLHTLDDLRSGASEAEIRCQLYQVAFELNVEVKSSLSRHFLENWYRHQHPDIRSVPAFYRWEHKLSELGPDQAIPLLLCHRYGFSEAEAAQILGRSESELNQIFDSLRRELTEAKGYIWSDLAKLPKYGFLQMPESQQGTALSDIMSQLRQNKPWWAFLALVIGLLGLGLLLWLVKEVLGFQEIWRWVRRMFWS